MYSSPKPEKFILNQNASKQEQAAVLVAELLNLLIMVVSERFPPASAGASSSPSDGGVDADEVPYHTLYFCSSLSKTVLAIKREPLRARARGGSTRTRFSLPLLCIERTRAHQPSTRCRANV